MDVAHDLDSSQKKTSHSLFIQRKCYIYICITCQSVVVLDSIASFWIWLAGVALCHGCAVLIDRLQTKHKGEKQDSAFEYAHTHTHGIRVVLPCNCCMFHPESPTAPHTHKPCSALRRDTTRHCHTKSHSEQISRCRGSRRLGECSTWSIDLIQLSSFSHVRLTNKQNFSPVCNCRRRSHAPAGSAVLWNV